MDELVVDLASGIMVTANKLCYLWFFMAATCYGAY